MCGRFALGLPPKSLAEYFQLDTAPEITPRYNVAPSQSVATIEIDREKGGRALKMKRWGLVPFWAKDNTIGARLINARAETAPEKPSFRSAFKHRRCLIPASGFYEWKRSDAGRRPYYFRMHDETPLAFAGLWEHWEGKTGDSIESCTILTTEANELMRPIHNRMPVILNPEYHDIWLDPHTARREVLEPLLIPYNSESLQCYPVSTYVNRPQNEDSKCIEPDTAI